MRGNPVELDDQAHSRPYEIHLVTGDPDAGLGLLDAPAVHEREAAFFERRSRPMPPSLHCLHHLSAAPPRIRLNDAIEGCQIEAVSVLRLRHRPS
jgi:hypothetical protein